MGAWIEINFVHFSGIAKWSLPLWERGLKCISANVATISIGSLPLWERGLKFQIVRFVGRWIEVAPLVGAWIEMSVFIRSIVTS